MARAIQFLEQTSVAGQGQEQYRDLPMYRGIIEEGPYAGMHNVICCYQLDPEEIDALKENGGKVWLRMLHGPQQPVVPNSLEVKSPFVR